MQAFFSFFAIFFISLYITTKDNLFLLKNIQGRRRLKKQVQRALAANIAIFYTAPAMLWRDVCRTIFSKQRTICIGRA
jgi:hypothetical protein